MKYAVLIYERPGSYDGFGPDERAAVSGEYTTIAHDPRVIAGGRLQPAETATTVRVDDGTALITDGPYADTKEVFGGYYIVLADDIDAVLDIARTIPAARLGGAVEVRPLAE
jgi:hypothetical protein